jgi:hypothetical protein
MQAYQQKKILIAKGLAGVSNADSSALHDSTEPTWKGLMSCSAAAAVATAASNVLPLSSRKGYSRFACGGHLTKPCTNKNNGSALAAAYHNLFCEQTDPSAAL